MELPLLLVGSGLPGEERQEGHREHDVEHTEPARMTLRGVAGHAPPVVVAGEGGLHRPGFIAT